MRPYLLALSLLCSACAGRGLERSDAPPTAAGDSSSTSSAPAPKTGSAPAPSTSSAPAPETHSAPAATTSSAPAPKTSSAPASSAPTAPETSSSAPAPETSSSAPAESAMTSYAMAFLLRGPAWTEPSRAESRVDQQHAAYVHELLEQGTALLAGPMDDEGPLRGAVVFKTASLDEARALIDADPAVKAGRLKVEMHPWYTMKDALKPPQQPLRPVTYYLTLLRRGPVWSPEETPERMAVQEAHMANIRRLGEAGTLVAAGPFGDDGELRGIFVFKAGSLEEATALTQTDPAVQAGRLAMELHPWRVPAGVLP